MHIFNNMLYICVLIVYSWLCFLAIHVSQSNYQFMQKMEIGNSTTKGERNMNRTHHCLDFGAGAAINPCHATDRRGGDSQFGFWFDAGTWAVPLQKKSTTGDLIG